MSAAESAAHGGPYAAFRWMPFRRYVTGNVFGMIGMQMQAAAVQWEVVSRVSLESTGPDSQKLAAMHLATVGILQFLPVLLLSLPAGQLADLFPRKRIVQLAMLLLMFGAGGMAFVSAQRWPLPWLYGFLVVNAVSRAIQQPANASLLRMIVPLDLFGNALTWHSTSFQLSMVLGPLLGGLILAVTLSPALVYFLEGLGGLIFLIALTFIAVPPQQVSSVGSTGGDLAAGFKFVWYQRVILSALSLDLFAVLLGGATSLLAIYSTDILNVEAALGGWRETFRRLALVTGFHGIQEQSVNIAAVGYGLMRAAPAVGALLTSVFLAHWSPLRSPGRSLLWSVAGFGVATIVFGFSRSFWLSLAMLFLIGAFDMISVIVRHTLVQLLTPDSMRGRVSAINGLFIGASNELGGAESGYVAALFSRQDDATFGPTVSVVSGGLGTLLVVGIIALLHPELRRLKKVQAADATGEVKELAETATATQNDSQKSVS